MAARPFTAPTLSMETQQGAQHSPGTHLSASHRRRKSCELLAPGRVKSCRLLRPVRSCGLAGRARTLGMPGLPGGAMVLGRPGIGVVGCMAPGVAGVNDCASTASLDTRNIASIRGTVFMVLFSVRDRRRHSHDCARATCERRAAGWESPMAPAWDF